MEIIFFNHTFYVESRSLKAKVTLKVLHDELSFVAPGSYSRVDSDEELDMMTQQLLQKRVDYMHSSCKYSFWSWSVYKDAFENWDDIRKNISNNASNGIIVTNQNIHWDRNNKIFKPLTHHTELGFSYLNTLPDDLFRWSDVWPAAYALSYLLSAFREHDDIEKDESVHFIKKKTICDLQTGTGFLGILSHKLGANVVYMADESELAMQIVTSNLILNNCIERKIGNDVTMSCKQKMKLRRLKRFDESRKALKDQEDHLSNLVALPLSLSKGHKQSLSFNSAETKKLRLHLSDSPHYMANTEANAHASTASKKKRMAISEPVSGAQTPITNKKSTRASIFDYDFSTLKNNNSSSEAPEIISSLSERRKSMPSSLLKGIFPKDISTKTKHHHYDTLFVPLQLKDDELSLLEWPEDVCDIVLGGDMFPRIFPIPLITPDVTSLAKLLKRILKPCGFAFFSSPVVVAGSTLSIVKKQFEDNDLYFDVHDPVLLSKDQMSYLNAEGMLDAPVVFIEIGHSYNTPQCSIRKRISDVMKQYLHLPLAHIEHDH